MRSFIVLPGGSVLAAASFARQTGDLRSLSRVDLKVIALAYMLERQETGAGHLRTAPIRPVNSQRIDFINFLAYLYSTSFSHFLKSFDESMNHVNHARRW